MNKFSILLTNCLFALLLSSCDINASNTETEVSQLDQAASFSELKSAYNPSSVNATPIPKVVPYGSNPQQTYDIYLPNNRNANTPIILMIHGGGWKGGDKKDFSNPVNYINYILNKWPDVAIVNMNYRLASNAKNIHHNEIMQDIKSVIGDVLNKKNTYNISSKMGIMGGSAGGHLAMLYAYKYNDYKNIKCVGNVFGPSVISDWSWYNSFNLWAGAKVGDVLTEYVGRPWDKTVYDSVSPYHVVKSTSQPTIIFHGTLDPIVPIYQSQWLRTKLNNLRVANQYHEYVAFHSFDYNQASDAMDKMISFFKPRLN